MDSAPLICFGYGSLVNTTTHEFTVLGTTALKGWRRAWAHRSRSSTLKATSLSVEADEAYSVAGLILEVPEAMQSDLARRERGYDFHLVAHASSDPGDVRSQLGTYITQEPQAGSAEYPILQSYLDVVLSGYFDHFGENGVIDFISSTKGWEIPILRDRSEPLYPRARHISRQLLDKTDDFLRHKGVTYI